MNKLKKIIKKKTVAITACAIAVAALLVTAAPILHNALYPIAATVAAKRQLPVYCVNTGDEKKIAISFDAAWGACQLRCNVKSA